MHVPEFVSQESFNTAGGHQEILEISKNTTGGDVQTWMWRCANERDLPSRRWQISPKSWLSRHVKFCFFPPWTDSSLFTAMCPHCFCLMRGFPFQQVYKKLLARAEEVVFSGFSETAYEPFNTVVYDIWPEKSWWITPWWENLEPW